MHAILEKASAEWSVTTVRIGATAHRRRSELSVATGVSRGPWPKRKPGIAPGHKYFNGGWWYEIEKRFGEKTLSA